MNDSSPFLFVCAWHHGEMNPYLVKGFILTSSSYTLLSPYEKELSNNTIFYEIAFLLYFSLDMKSRETLLRIS